MFTIGTNGSIKCVWQFEPHCVFECVSLLSSKKKLSSFVLIRWHLWKWSGSAALYLPVYQTTTGSSGRPFYAAAQPPFSLLVWRWGDKCSGRAESIGKPISLGFLTCARSSGCLWQTMTSEAEAVAWWPDPRGPEGWRRSWKCHRCGSSHHYCRLHSLDHFSTDPSYRWARG